MTSRKVVFARPSASIGVCGVKDAILTVSKKGGSLMMRSSRLEEDSAQRKSALREAARKREDEREGKTVTTLDRAVKEGGSISLLFRGPSSASNVFPIVPHR